MPIGNSKSLKHQKGMQVLRFAGLVWQGPVRDLPGRRDEAPARYREALKAPDNLTIIKPWAEQRLQTPYAPYGSR